MAVEIGMSVASLDTHQNEECPQRPYSCEYCKEYDSTFEDVTESHFDECGKYPVTCPNKCQDDPFERSKIEDHLNDECPLTEVSCPFAYAGCEVKLPRKDMPGHTLDISIHFPLLASFTRIYIAQKQKATERQFEEKLSAMERQFEEKLKVMKGQFEEKLKAAEKQYQEKWRATETFFKTKLAMFKDTQKIKSAMGKFPIDFQVTYEKKTSSCPFFQSLR